MSEDSSATQSVCQQTHQHYCCTEESKEPSIHVPETKVMPYEYAHWLLPLLRSFHFLAKCGLSCGLLLIFYPVWYFLVEWACLWDVSRQYQQWCSRPCSTLMTLQTLIPGLSSLRHSTMFQLARWVFWIQGDIELPYVSLLVLKQGPQIIANQKCADFKAL